MFELLISRRMAPSCPPYVDRSRISDWTHHVRLLGWKPHETLPGLLRSSDELACFPFAPLRTSRITLANKQFDYMAVGLPVVASDVPPMRRIIDETGKRCHRSAGGSGGPCRSDNIPLLGSPAGVRSRQERASGRGSEIQTGVSTVLVSSRRSSAGPSHGEHRRECTGRVPDHDEGDRAGEDSVVCGLAGMWDVSGQREDQCMQIVYSRNRTRLSRFP